MSVSIERLRHVFSYNPSTGILTWRINTGKKRMIGKSAGSDNGTGHLRLRIDRCDLYVHRIVWAMTYGYWPTRGIDHINGNPCDNRIENLREANQSQNVANSRNMKNKLKGASYRKSLGRWRSQIMVKGKYIHLGNFDSEQEAHEAYCAAAEKHFSTFARRA